MGWFHRHRWEVVSASSDEKLHLIDPGGTQPLMYALVTHVVSKCRCGLLKHERLCGQHTVESLRGEDSEVARVLERMK